MYVRTQMIMIVGLPGSGKTTWGLTMLKQYPYKRYNIIGTDTLIEKMRVMGLPRRNNYHGRWEVLIQKATNCLNKLFQIGLLHSLAPAIRVGLVPLLKFLVSFSCHGKTVVSLLVLSYLYARNLFLAIVPLFEEISRFPRKLYSSLVQTHLLSQVKSNEASYDQDNYDLDL